MPATTCLTTVVRNISGASRYFAYIGRRGTVLDNNEVYNVPGDLVADLAKDPRKWAAFEDDLLNNRIEIVETPAVHLKNLTTGVTQILTFEDVAGTPTLGTANPCWQ